MPNALEAQRAERDRIRAMQGDDGTEKVETVEEDDNERIETATDDDDTEEVDEPEAEEESEEESKGEEESKPEEDSTKKESPFKRFNERRNELYQTENNYKEILSLIGAESPEDAKAKLAELRSSAPISEDFIAAAKEMGVEDPENLKRLSDLIRGQLAPELSKVNEANERIQQFTEQQAEQQEFKESVEGLQIEWKQILPDLESNYTVTATNAEKAFDLLVDLAHSEKYWDKDIDYIMFKEQTQFEDILGAPKRKGMLRSRGIAEPVREESKGVLPKIDANDHNSVMKAQAKMKAIADGEATLNDEESDYI